MNRFTIKDIENLSGIKAHTWRIWEQRYGVGMPQRKESNHRFYNNENLKQILRISYLYHNGFKISKIAALDAEELRNKALTNDQADNRNEFYIKELVEASIDLNEQRFERTFVEALQTMGVENTFIHILYAFQQKIGVLWLTDHVIPSQEHFTSNIIRQKITVAIDDLPSVASAGSKQVVLFTPQREHHEIPLQFIHYNLKKNNIKVVYFGSNVKMEDIQSYADVAEFSHLFFHLITNLTNQSPEEYLQSLCKLFPGKRIVMSGSQVHQITNPPINAKLLTSIDEMLQFARE